MSIIFHIINILAALLTEQDMDALIAETEKAYNALESDFNKNIQIIDAKIIESTMDWQKAVLKKSDMKKELEELLKKQAEVEITITTEKAVLEMIAEQNKRASNAPDTSNPNREIIVYDPVIAANNIHYDPKSEIKYRNRVSDLFINHKFLLEKIAELKEAIFKFSLEGHQNEMLIHAEQKNTLSKIMENHKSAKEQKIKEFEEEKRKIIAKIEKENQEKAELEAKEALIRSVEELSLANQNLLDLKNSSESSIANYIFGFVIITAIVLFCAFYFVIYK
jgi:hypothetical protein